MHSKILTVATFEKQQLMLSENILKKKPAGLKTMNEHFLENITEQRREKSSLS